MGNYMIKSALIIVPHQDDELNISGFILNRLIKEKVDIRILYVTNGNFYKDKYKWRQKERDKVLKLYGDIKYKQLDYDDGYDYKGHLFNEPQVRSKIEKDIYEYILKCRSDLVVCVDFDSHADHRMVSALFDKAMCRVLKEECQYHPIVLKKFAYLGVWTGENDYFSIYPMRTCEYQFCNKKQLYLEAIPNAWEDRICIATEKDDYSLKFWRSKVFKAYRKYWTQCGYRFFFCASNTDVVYWFRNTDNLMLRARLSADSGNVSLVNDFSLGNITSITRNFKSVEEKFPNSAWIPTDSQKELNIFWNKPVRIKTIKLYQNFSILGHIRAFQVSDKQGYNEILECDEKDVNYFYLKQEIHTDRLVFKILESNGAAGIRELEMYMGEGRFPWKECPFERYTGNGSKRTKIGRVLACKIEHIMWTVLRTANKARKTMGLSYWES